MVNVWYCFMRLCLAMVTSCLLIFSPAHGIPEMTPSARIAGESRYTLKQPHAGRYALLIATGKVTQKANGQSHLICDPIVAPQNDVALMAALLVGRFGFSPDHILIVGAEKDTKAEIQRLGPFRFASAAEATKAAIRAGFGWLNRSVTSPTDIAVVYYSGHGTNIVDTSGDELFADANDQAIVPYDTTGPSDLILDDEIHARLSHLRTHHVTYIVDTCFGGGMAASPAEGGSSAMAFPTEGLKEATFVDQPRSHPAPQDYDRQITIIDAQRAGCTVIASSLRDESSATKYWGQGGAAFSPFTLALCRYAWRTSGSVRLARLAKDIGPWTKSLGGTDQTPIVVRSRASGKDMIVSTPNYQPGKTSPLSSVLSSSRGRQLLVGRLVIQSRSPASTLRVSLPPGHHLKMSWISSTFD